jgi:hypothetical protein
MSQPPDDIPSVPVQRETLWDKQLPAIFDDLKRKQLDFLDAAAKSMIERIAAFLTILFAVTAFSANFPPPYLRNNVNPYLVIAVLGCYLIAMALGMWAIQPHKYKDYENNLTEMHKEWEKLVNRKKICVRLAGLLFALGSLILAVLIILIILGR